MKNPKKNEPTYIPHTVTNRKEYTRGRRLDRIMVSEDLLTCNKQIIHKADCNLGECLYTKSDLRSSQENSS